MFFSKNTAQCAALSLAILTSLSGCAFDVISLKQQPVVFQSAGTSNSFILTAITKVRLEEGRAVPLKAGTHWKQVGTIAQGNVFRTKDQVVTVEASNQYEADIVLVDRSIVGFYLPVEQSFVAVDKPTAIPVKFE